MAKAKQNAEDKKAQKEAELVVETAPAEPAAETEQSPETTETEAPKATAKAGKRSSKGIEEAEAKTEKLEHQKHREDTAETTDAKPKQPVKPARSKLERRSKSFRKAAEKIEAGKQYSLDEAIGLAKQTSTTKFDATVELHVRLGVDPRQADQNIRDNLVLPAGTGKTVRIAVFAEADDAATAKKAGADIAGVEELTKELEKGIMNFDTLIATPSQMPKLGKYARTLGPRGLMPNPKSGTVTTDIAKAVSEAKAGRVEYRVDSTGIVHLAVGKVSFTPVQLRDNVQAVFTSLKGNKPSSLKGTYINSMYLATTMGPSIAVQTSDL